MEAQNEWVLLEQYLQCFTNFQQDDRVDLLVLAVPAAEDFFQELQALYQSLKGFTLCLDHQFHVQIPPQIETWSVGGSGGIGHAGGNSVMDGPEVSSVNKEEPASGTWEQSVAEHLEGEGNSESGVVEHVEVEIPGTSKGPEEWLDELLADNGNSEMQQQPRGLEGQPEEEGGKGT